ncbi:MAG: hypothetical protein IJY84_03990 [Clostridia bacterium]|nr:hypothetical protein [Clostridia bacterium]
MGAKNESQNHQNLSVTIVTTKFIIDDFISLFVISVVLALTLFGDVTTFDWSTIYYHS